jgi:hypothetical protein
MTELEKLEEKLCELRNRESNILREIQSLNDLIYRHRIKLTELKFPNAKGKLFWFSDKTIAYPDDIGAEFIIGNLIRPFSREELRCDGEKRFYSMNREGEEIGHGYKYAFPVKEHDIKLWRNGYGI